MTVPQANLTIYQGSLFTVTIPGGGASWGIRMQLRSAPVDQNGIASVTLTSGGGGIAWNGTQWIATITPTQSNAMTLLAGVWDAYGDPDGAPDNATVILEFGEWSMRPFVTATTVTPEPPSLSPAAGNALLWNGSQYVPGPINLAGGSNSITGSIPLSADEKLYWQHQAALLDPAAYRYYQQTVVSPTLPQTVPAGTAWYIRNSAALLSGDVTSDVRVKYFRNAREKRIASAGTTLTAQATNGFAYVCQPEIVIVGDARYTSDPKGLYYSRLAQLQSLAQTDASCGSSLTRALSAPTSGICMAIAVSQFELTWSLLSNSNNVNAINLISEIDDAMTSRFSSELMLPFPISIFNQITRGINLGAQDTPGCLTLTYCELPVGW